MPTNVSLWACSYGCGRRPIKDRKVIEKHEQTCALNPDRRACKICKHKLEFTLPADIPGRVMVEPLCALGVMPCGALMHFNCDSWEPKSSLISPI